MDAEICRETFWKENTSWEKAFYLTLEITVETFYMMNEDGLSHERLRDRDFFK